MDENKLDPNAPGQAVPTQELPDLGPKTSSNSPSTTRNFPVSDPNLKPLTVNLPADPIETTPIAINNSPLPASTPNPSVVPTPQPTPTTVPATVGQPITSTPAQAEVFINPNQPPPPINVGSEINSTNPPTPSNNKLHSLPISKGLILGIIVVIVVFGSGAFAVNEFVLNKITSLKLISADSQFYLSLAVKKNPQAEKAKDLIKKFPGGDTVLKQFDKYYAGFTGSDPKNPLNDITQYANTELLFARSTRASSTTDTSNRLISIVDLASSKDAADNITNFSDDKATYKVTDALYKGSKLYTIKLVSEQKLYEDQLNQKSKFSSSYATPKPQTITATNIDKFIVASDKDTDVQKAVDLSQNKTVFGFGGSATDKSILDSTDHQQISNLFAKDTFIKFFQRDPITPYNQSVPFYTPSVSTAANAAETEAKTYQKISRGMDAVVVNDGLQIDSYSIDYKLANDTTSSNVFKIGNGLASKLPKQYAGVAPTVYFETQNLNGQWQKQNKIAQELKDSKSRAQRDSFSSYLDSISQMKKSYQETYGIDYEADILSWMDGQVATIFNAGKSKKGPELLLVAEIKDQTKVENSLKKISVKDPYAQANDLKRESDLRQIMTGLEVYYTMNYQYPASLAQLTVGQTSTYLKTIPKDPVTKKDYSYSLAADKQDFTLSVNLDNGQTLTYDKDTTAKLTGTKKDLRSTPKPTTYKTTSIYQLAFPPYGNIKYSFYFTVTKNKAVIALSDSDKSLKDIIDFEAAPAETLTKNPSWQKQFGKNQDDVLGVSFVEPINLWGLMDYIKEAYPQYKDSISSYSPDAKTYLDDIEKTVKGYLRTIPSIGAVEGKKNGVTFTNTLVNVVELSAKDKKESEDALGRLIKTDNSNQYKSVLGINSETTFDKVKNDWNKFFQTNLKPILNPQTILPN